MGVFRDCLLQQILALNSGLSTSGSVRDNELSKKRRVAKDGRRQKGERLSKIKMADKRGARAWPFEVFVFALGKTLHSPFLPRGSASKDQLGMRQGAEGGDLTASVPWSPRPVRQGGTRGRSLRGRVEGGR